MPKQKIDGIVEAVHFEQEGVIKWVRLYLRRGGIFSDRQIIDRQALIDFIKAGKKIYSGKRVALMGGTFEVGEPLRLLQKGGAEVLILGEKESNKDSLAAVPRI